MYKETKRSYDRKEKNKEEEDRRRNKNEGDRTLEMDKKLVHRNY